MRSSVYLNLLKFSCIIASTSATVSVKDCVQIIADVHQFFKSSSVTMYFTDHKDLWQMELIFNVQLLLSREKIKTATINLEEISSINNENLTNLQRLKKGTKPMIVFLITTETGWIKMKNLTKKLHLSNTIKLLLFMKTDERPFFEFCPNLVENPLHLRVGEEVLVKCYEDTLIREWHALNANEMNVHEWAPWEPSTKTLLKLENSMYKEGDALNGKVLYTATIAESAILGKYFDSLRTVLEETANFTMKQIKVEENYEKWNESGASWSGPIDLIVNREVDLVAVWYFINAKTFHVVDYTTDLIELEFFLFTKTQINQVSLSWFGYWQLFTLKMWIVVGLIYSGNVAILMFMKAQLPQYYPPVYGSLFNNMSNLCTIFFLQSTPNSEMPNVLSIKIFYCVTYLYAYFVHGLYFACFTKSLATCDVSLPFRSLEEFSKVGSHKLAVLRYNGYYEYVQDAGHSSWKEAKKFLLPKSELPTTYAEAMDMICNDNVAFFTNELFQSLVPENVRTMCPLAKVSTGEYNRYAMILTKNSPYKNAINYYITKIKNHGILRRIESALVLKVKTVREQPEEEEEYNPVSIMDVGVLFIELVILYLIVIPSAEFIEYIYFKNYRVLQEHR